MGISKVCLLALVALMAVAMTQGFYYNLPVYCPKKCGFYARCVVNRTRTQDDGYDYKRTYSCKCLKGYTGDGITCKRTNPCAKDPCHEHAHCIPWGIKAICRCNLGYQGSGYHCKKFVPCNNRCHKHAQCIPYGYGYGYRCKCKYGFRGNGYYCRKYQAYRPTYYPPSYGHDW